MWIVVDPKNEETEGQGVTEHKKEEEKEHEHFVYLIIGVFIFAATLKFFSRQSIIDNAT